MVYTATRGPGARPGELSARESDLRQTDLSRLQAPPDPEVVAVDTRHAHANRSPALYMGLLTIILLLLLFDPWLADYHRRKPTTMRNGGIGSQR